MATNLERIRFRRGTAAQWTASNTVLASGEPGFETDTGKFKLGDGVTAWKTLAYEPTKIDWVNVQGAPAFVTTVNGKTPAAGSSSVTLTADNVGDGTAKVLMTPAERTKLTGVQTSATANQTDTYLLDRAHHTGVQDISTITGLVAALNGLMTKAGSIRQAADVSKVIPTDGQMYRQDPNTNLLEPFDPETVFALLDPNTNRLSQTAEPLDFHPIKVLNVGEVPPVGTRLDTIIFEKTASVNLTPGYLDDTVSQGSSTNVLSVPQLLTVGTDIGLAVYASNEVSTSPFTSVSAAYSTGAGAVTFATWSIPNSTAAVDFGTARITTQVPANATITLTFKDSTGATLSRVHGIASLFILPGLAANPIDQQVVSGGNSSTTMTTIATSATPFNTVQPNEIAIGIAGWNSLAAPGSRTLANSYLGWTKLAEVKSDNGSTGRSMAVFYQILDTIQKPSFATSMTSSDGSTGQWATQLVTLKAAS